MVLFGLFGWGWWHRATSANKKEAGMGEGENLAASSATLAASWSGLLASGPPYSFPITKDNRLS